MGGPGKKDPGGRAKNERELPHNWLGALTGLVRPDWLGALRLLRVNKPASLPWVRM